ncbi:chitinase-like protein EN03 isoform X1 [Frieseomelitta varia]|uniref:chitinase-like protein EN03 isoform X1 n=1 Tax=Frieseomelitta varia TaxID=561572 RepID=UPI001CB6AC06|nr:chitinase-like protein EN03 isoform X1 [Frieseomelitta varia]XP_043523464.1 chitinase-like protein EN03 isoform X1 [Frieseomelitta varia]
MRMKVLIFAVVAVFYVQSALGVDTHEHNKVVCYWNSTAFDRQGPGKFQLDDVRSALSLCTHLVYGFAGISADSFEVVPLNPTLDTGVGYSYYKLATQLKRTFPELKVYLGIGGNADPNDDTHKYLVLTETAESRSKFINSVNRLLNDYDFDGIDLAWQFPTVKVKKQRGTFGSLWHGLKKTFGYGKFKDDKELEHRDGFTILVRDLKAQLRPRMKALTVTVLPHVNSSVYYDARLLAPNIDAVHLFTFDQKTPERNPQEADYPAPIYESYGRVPQDNVDATTSIDLVSRYWLENGTPGSKIVVGIPTYARTWKLTSDSQISGVPPIVTDGPGAEGPHTNVPGLLSYAEVCSRLTESAVGRLRRVGDPSKKYGGYAYQPYNENTGEDGIWVGYEDPDTAGNKAAYAKAKGLGGVVIYDLSLDDFRGVCTGDKFPIIRGAKYKL